jgi:hypothetical protein
MWNKIGLLVASATLTLTQSVGFAQDSSSPNASAELYEINGLSSLSQVKILGSFTVNNTNNDELIDKSELSDFKLTLIYENITLSCPLSALSKFQLSDSQHFLRRYRQLGEFAQPRAGFPVGFGLVNLELSCQSKDAEFSISSSQLHPLIRGKIKTRNNHSQTEQNSDSRGMEITYLTGISHQRINFEAPLNFVYIRPINQNISRSQTPNAQTSTDAINIQRVSFNNSFILTEGKTVKIYTKELRGLVSGYKVSMLNFKNNRAVIKIEQFEEYPRPVSTKVSEVTLSLSEPQTITPSKELILSEEYALKFLGFPRSGGIELIVLPKLNWSRDANQLK